jgi:hypothetical protein
MVKCELVFFEAEGALRMRPMAAIVQICFSVGKLQENKT